MYWSVLIWSTVYIFAGYFVTKIVCTYLEKLGDDVEAIDYRYRKNLFLKLRANSEKQKDMWEVVLLAIWPAFCIAAIIKAEYNYDSIVRRNVKRAP